MSNDELDAIIGRAAREHSDAVKKLAALEAKARGYANNMRIAANELSPSRTAIVPDYNRQEFGDLLKKYPNRDEIETLLAEITETRQSVHERASELSRMGIAPTA